MQDQYAEDFIGKNFVGLATSFGASCCVDLIHGKAEAVGNAICERSEQLDASLVVVATHKKSKLQEVLMGSVSMQVGGWVVIV